MRLLHDWPSASYIFTGVFNTYILTVAAHANGEALFEPTELATVPVQPDHETLTVTEATVLNLLLDAPSEETL